MFIVLSCHHDHKVIARVHSVHLMKVEHRQAAVDPQTKPRDLGCEFACRQLSSTTTIAIYYYYSAPKLIFTVPRRVEGWVDLGTAGKVHTARAQSCKSQWLCDKHNYGGKDLWKRWVLSLEWNAVCLGIFSVENFEFLSDNIQLHFARLHSTIRDNLPLIQHWLRISSHFSIENGELLCKEKDAISPEFQSQ